jgi:hypothetical protein
MFLSPEENELIRSRLAGLQQPANGQRLLHSAGGPPERESTFERQMVDAGPPEKTASKQSGTLSGDNVKTYVLSGESHDMYLMPFSTGANTHGKVTVNPTGNGKAGNKYSLNDVLVIPPKHFYDNSSQKIETELQTLNAFDALLHSYNRNMFLPGGRADTSRHPPSSRLPRKGRGGENCYVTAGLYAWRTSPSLNWKIKRMEDDEQAVSSRGAALEVPIHSLIVSSSVRLELVMLGYRYAMLVLNKANHEYNQATETNICASDNVDEQQGVSDSILRMSECLGRAYSIMIHVVKGLLKTWIGMPTKRPCAELTLETCEFFEHLLVATRNSNGIRRRRLTDLIRYRTESIRVANAREGSVYVSRNKIPNMTGEDTAAAADGGDDSDNLYVPGVLTHKEWARTYMSVAIAFYKAQKIYTEFISVLYGNSVCTRNKNPVGYTPPTFHIVTHLQLYMNKVFLFSMASAMFFHAESLQNDAIDEPMPREDTFAFQKQMQIIRSLSMVGIACARPLKVSSSLFDMETQVTVIIEMLKDKIHKCEIPDGIRRSRAGVQPLNLQSFYFPKYRKAVNIEGIDFDGSIVDMDGLLEHFVIIKEYLTEKETEACGIDNYGEEFKDHICKYVPKGNRSGVAYAAKAAIHVPLNVEKNGHILTAKEKWSELIKKEPMGS